MENKINNVEPKCLQNICAEEKTTHHPKLFQLLYNPQPDITTFELAQVVGLSFELSNSPFPLSEEALEMIPLDIKKHYTIKEVSEEFYEMVEKQQNNKTCERS